MIIPSSIAWMRRLLRARGFEIRRITPRALRGPIADVPAALLDQASWLSRSVLVDIPVERCRDAMGARPDENPFVAACASPPHAQPMLAAYYDAFQPETAADVLGLSPAEAPGLADLPALAYVLPWEGWSPDDALQDRAAWIAQEAQTHGFDLDLDDGIHHFGPVADAKTEMEVVRLTRLRTTIEEDGYQRSDEPDGDVQGTVLLGDDGDWCVHTGSGQHRLAVSAALAQPTIPVRILRAPISRSMSALWPHVATGLVTEKGARSLFDRFMSGGHPVGMHSEPVQRGLHSFRRGSSRPSRVG